MCGFSKYPNLWKWPLNSLTEMLVGQLFALCQREGLTHFVAWGCKQILFPEALHSYFTDDAINNHWLDRLWSVNLRCICFTLLLFLHSGSRAPQPITADLVAKARLQPLPTTRTWTRLAALRWQKSLVFACVASKEDSETQVYMDFALKKMPLFAGSTKQ